MFTASAVGSGHPYQGRRGSRSMMMKLTETHCAIFLEARAGHAMREQYGGQHLCVGPCSRGERYSKVPAYTDF